MSNTAGGKVPSTPRLSEYATNALEKIRKELRMFSIGDVQVNLFHIPFKLLRGIQRKKNRKWFRINLNPKYFNLLGDVLLQLKLFYDAFSR